jgi:hypothetical protein
MDTTFKLKTLTRYLLLAGLAIQLLGCAVTQKYHVSVADGIPAGAIKIKPDKSTLECLFGKGPCQPPSGSTMGYVGQGGEDLIFLILKDLGLWIQVQDHVYTGETHFGFIVPFIPFHEKEGEISGPLRVWLDFVPKDDAFSFDPGRVALKNEDGTSVPTVNFVGPSNPWGSPRAVQQGCGERRYSLGTAVSRTEVRQEDVKMPQGPIALSPSWGSFPFKGHSCFMLWFDVDPSPERSFVLSLGGITKDGVQYPVPEIRFKAGLTSRYFVVP